MSAGAAAAGAEPGRPLPVRVVGDVHGDAAGFAHAVEGARASGRFLVQLGDLTDHGPDPVGVLRLMLGVLERGEGLFVLGNHDHKLRRALDGGRVFIQPEGLGLTLDAIESAPDAATLAPRVRAAIAAAPAWWRHGRALFVHAGFHPAMIDRPPPPGAGAGKPEGLVTRALFGQVTGRRRADGHPERLHDWVARVPRGLTVYCGHEQRSTDGRPYVVQAQAGGSVVFLDTGAGKGGHLSWLDVAA